jgi:hypothetical protein
VWRSNNSSTPDRGIASIFWQQERRGLLMEEGARVNLSKYMFRF